MRRLRTVLILAILLAVLVVPLAMAQGNQSIAAIAAANPDFSTLSAAIEAAGLSDALSGGSWTVFAPTNAAFAQLGLTADNVAKTLTADELKGLLLYHALPKSVSTLEAKTMLGDVTMANGQTAGWKWYDGSLYINDDAKVITPNVIASNGTIHVVDTVIQGPWPRPAEESAASGDTEAPVDTTTQTIVEIVNNDSRFRTAAAAIEYAGLSDTLSSGVWTLFAPTNAAFSQAGIRTSNLSKLFTPEEMADFLLYHVLPEHMSIAKGRTMLGDVTMANGLPAGLKWFRGSIWVNDVARVVVRDIHAKNGVVHGVNSVILPPWPRVEQPAMDAQ